MDSGSLRDPRVRIFLVAEAFSAIGTFATFIAIWAYAAFEFDASASDVAVFGVALTLPGILLGTVAGAAIDRFGARPVLAAAKATGVAASLALLLADDYRTLALLSAVHGVVGAFTIPSLQSLPPLLVGDDELARTNALVSLTDEFAIIAGPVVGALAIAAVGFRGAFVVDAATYLLGLVVLPLVRVRTVERDTTERASLRFALGGLGLVWRTPALRRIVALTFGVHMLYGAAILMEPLYVRDVLERPPTVFAAIQTVFGIFLVGGGLLVAALGDRLTSYGWVAAGTAASGVGAIVYMGTPWIAVAFIGSAGWGLVTAVLSGPTRTILQRNARESIHGRVMATDLVAASSAELFGIVASALLVETFGIRTTITVLGLSVFVGAGLLRIADRRDRPAATPVKVHETTG